MNCGTHAPPTGGSTVPLPPGAPTTEGDLSLPALLKSKPEILIFKMCNLLIFKHWQLTHTFSKTLWAKQNTSGDQIQSTGSQPYTTKELLDRPTGWVWDRTSRIVHFGFPQCRQTARTTHPREVPKGHCSLIPAPKGPVFWKG